MTNKINQELSLRIKKKEKHHHLNNHIAKLVRKKAKIQRSIMIKKKATMKRRMKFWIRIFRINLNRLRKT
jgi:hypothetical protein